MPYITDGERDMLQPVQPAEGYPTTKGQLTYIFTREINQFLQIRGIVAGRRSFDDYADAIAALECAKLELYRRMVAPHEDSAIQRNGDVYTP